MTDWKTQRIREALYPASVAVLGVSGGVPVAVDALVVIS